MHGIKSLSEFQNRIFKPFKGRVILLTREEPFFFVENEVENLMRLVLDGFGQCVVKTSQVGLNRDSLLARMEDEKKNWGS